VRACAGLRRQGRAILTDCNLHACILACNRLAGIKAGGAAGYTHLAAVAARLIAFTAQAHNDRMD
jgi:hypothetical protein